jgi:hypothetical protein
MKKQYTSSLFLFIQVSAQGLTKKNYSKWESEGWLNQNQKIDYWFYYYENGSKKGRRSL